MKTIFHKLLTISIFISSTWIFAQSPAWTIHKIGMKQNIFIDSSCTNNSLTEYCEHPFKIKEEHYGILDRFFNCFLNTKNGDIWMGTDDGISKFDGTNWTVYTGQNSQFSDGSVYTLLEHNGDIWAGTKTGIYVF